MWIKCSCNYNKNSQYDQKISQTNIRASPAAVLSPTLRSNRTHHEERLHLKNKKRTQSSDLVRFFLKKQQMKTGGISSKYFIIVLLLDQVH